MLYVDFQQYAPMRAMRHCLAGHPCERQPDVPVVPTVGSYHPAFFSASWRPTRISL